MKRRINLDRAAWLEFLDSLSIGRPWPRQVLVLPAGMTVWCFRVRRQSGAPDRDSRQRVIDQPVPETNGIVFPTHRGDGALVEVAFPYRLRGHCNTLDGVTMVYPGDTMRADVARRMVSRGHGVKVRPARIVAPQVQEGVATGDTRRSPGRNRHFQRRQAVENGRIGTSPCSDSPVAKPRDGVYQAPRFNIDNPLFLALYGFQTVSAAADRGGNP